jgi:CHASE3 domain sensor protein
LREVLIEALSLGFGVAKLVLVYLIMVGTFLVHSVSYDANKQAHNEAKELKAVIVELESKII